MKNIKELREKRALRDIRDRETENKIKALESMLIAITEPNNYKMVKGKDGLFEQIHIAPITRVDDVMGGLMTKEALETIKKAKK